MDEMHANLAINGVPLLTCAKLKLNVDSGNYDVNMNHILIEVQPSVIQQAYDEWLKNGGADTQPFSNFYEENYE